MAPVGDRIRHLKTRYPQGSDMGKVMRLVPKRQLVQREAAASIASQLGTFPEAVMPPWVKEALLGALQRITSPDTETSIWPGGFTMLSRAQTAAVWDAIRALPAAQRPQLVRHAFDLVLLNLRQDTGEVMLTRDQLAERMGCAPGHVSRAMGTLETMGVIRRERRRVEGIQGRGIAVYFINPHVAWNGSLSIRQDEAAGTSKPFLQLVENASSHKA